MNAFLFVLGFILGASAALIAYAMWFTWIAMTKPAALQKLYNAYNPPKS